MIAKAELHVHLEGTIRPEIAQMIAQRNHLKFPEYLLDDSQCFYRSQGFHDFLKAFDKLAALILKPQDYFDITYDYLKQSALSGVIYTEMMFSPDHAEKVSQIPYHEHLIAIGEAIQKAQDDFEIVSRIIMTAVRHFGVDACEQVAQNVHTHPFSFVTGFGLGGDELGFPPVLFKKTYAIAKDAGLKTTIHAGEWGNPESIKLAIDTCQVDRIGHGVRAIEDKNILSMLRDLKIPLEICPSSNVVLGIYPSIEAHPLPLLIQAGILVSINSDDPPFMATTIDKEYHIVQKTFGWNDQKMKTLTKQAIEVAFIDEQLKNQLLEKVV